MLLCHDIAGAVTQEDPIFLPSEVSSDSDIASGSKPEVKVTVIDLDFEDSAANVLPHVMSVRDLRKHVTLGWRNIDVSVQLPRASICRRACCGEASDEPQIKQILSDGQFSYTVATCRYFQIICVLYHSVTFLSILS